MDKKELSGMDPKLKEAYEKVMNTNITPAKKEVPLAKPEPSKPPQPTPIVTNANQVISYNVKSQKKGMKGFSLMPLFIILGVVFLLIYTIIWAKIIGVKLPFLPF